MSDNNVVIVGLGAATPVGRSAWASAAAVRAGVSGFTQHAFMVDTVGDPMHVAACPWLDDVGDLGARMAQSLVSAVDEAIAPLKAAPHRPPMALLINLPGARPGLPPDLAKRIGARLQQAMTGMFERVSVAALGHAGGLVALKSAQQFLAATPQSVCVMVGVDSYLEPDMLEWLEETDQLHGAGERNNAWGFVPGEGAGAVLLATSDTAQTLGLTPLGLVRGVGLGREAELIGTGTVCLGLGLTQAVRGAFAGLPEGARVTDVYCDMNGEPYRADEFAFLVTRTRERFVAPSEFMAPADCWGDVGAASAPLSIVLACVAGAKRYAKGAHALIWASSVSGERGAALIETIGAR